MRKMSRPEREWISGGLIGLKGGFCEYGNEKSGLVKCGKFLH